MAFFISGALVQNQMVLGVQERTTKANKPFVMLSVADMDGNANSFSCSEPETMAVIRSLRQGQHVDLRLVIAGGPNKQYAMVARGADAVTVLDSPSLGY